MLRLNTRDYLPLARREAFDSYRARLVEYIKLRDDGARRSVLNRRVSALRRMAHPYVWAEMKRQRVVVEELGRLFEQVPEALNM